MRSRKEGNLTTLVGFLVGYISGQPGRHKQALRPAHGPFRTGPYGPGPVEKHDSPGPKIQTAKIRSGPVFNRAERADRWRKAHEKAIWLEPLDRPSNPPPLVPFPLLLDRFHSPSPHNASSSPIPNPNPKAMAPSPAASPLHRQRHLVRVRAGGARVRRGRSKASTPSVPSSLVPSRAPRRGRGNLTCNPAKLR